ncbi:MAG: putative manganese transporter [Bacteroidota bacterium]
MLVAIIKQSVMITSFVLVMMLIIEFINVQSKGNWSKPLQKNRWLQVLVASAFGVIPGCLGTYTIVSLYTHNIIGFGALTASMIATFGDEAFVMLSIMPGTAVKIIIILFITGVLTGLIINLFNRKVKLQHEVLHFQIHEHEIKENNFSINKIIDNFIKISFHRAILIFAFSLFVFGIIIGEFGHDHDQSFGIDKNKIATENIQFSGIADEKLTNTEIDSNSDWDWIRITFLFVSIVALIIICIVPDHFLQEHIWEHIMKKHFLRIFLWTLIAMTGIALLKNYLDFELWIGKNQIYILLFAVLIGIIPESGPHLIFVSMFYFGTIPLSILLANSIVQDGHGGLPLFAESKRSFVKMKLINMLVGLIVGFAGYFTGW